MATAPPTPTLYVILGSHACRTGMLLLEHKGISYRTVELVTGLHPVGVRLRGFPGNAGAVRDVDGRRTASLAMADRLGTVPALAIGGERVQSNRKIARFLDRLQPDPPLCPAGPELRRAVEEAERWGDAVFQMAARRLVLAAGLHGRDAMRRRGNDGRLGPLLFQREPVRFAFVHSLARFTFGANPETERELLAALPAMLDRIDSWIDAGVLGGESLNAADYMLVTSLALIDYRTDLHPEMAERPAGALVERVLPEPARPPEPAPSPT